MNRKLMISSLRMSLKLFTHFLVFIVMIGSSIAQETRPNIVLILVDDLRYDALSSTGHPFFQSPNIDRIADEGVNFSSSFVVASICRPSRSTILTGLYPHIHGATNNSINLDYDRFVTFPSLLQQNGYETGMIGKDHTTNSPYQKPGFNYWASWTNARTYFDTEMLINGQMIQTSGHITDVVTDLAIDFIHENADTSFFLLLSHKAVHKPVIPQERFSGMYDNVEMPLPATWGEDLSTKPSFIQDMDNPEEEWLGAYMRDYLETLAGVEESVDTLLSTLEDLEILDETVVIFTSDHGLLLGEHNQFGKILIYEESVQIPFFIRFPNGFSSEMDFADATILNLDIAPTILRAAGIEIPEEMQGLPVQDLLSGTRRRETYLFKHKPSNPNGPMPAMSMVRNSNYKYALYPKTHEIEELYNLQSDPHEVINLFFDPSYDDLRDSLRVVMDSLRFALGDTLEGSVQLSIPPVDAGGQHVVNIPLQVNFPEGTFINRFSISLSGFSEDIMFDDLRCYGSCLLQPMGSWQIEESQSGRLRINGWTETEGMSSSGTLFWLRAILSESSAFSSLPLKIESALFNNGQYPVSLDQGQDPPDYVMLTPAAVPTEIPATGGRVDYHFRLQNPKETSTRVKVRLFITLPNGHRYGPVAGTPRIFRLNPDRLISVDLGQGIPGSAPAGDYELYGLVEDVSHTLLDSSGFIFTKTDGPALRTVGMLEGDQFQGWSAVYTVDNGKVQDTDLWTEEGYTRVDGSVIGTAEILDLIEPELPQQFYVKQNYPNPFNPSTTISYGLPEDAPVSLIIYDVHGDVVKTLESGYQTAGWYHLVWNGETDEGYSLSTGIYIARIVAGDYKQVIKMAYIK